MTLPLFRYCAALDHPMADSYCQGKPHPECATCDEELLPAEPVDLPPTPTLEEINARQPEARKMTDILIGGDCPHCHEDEFVILWRPLVRCWSCGRKYLLKRKRPAPKDDGGQP